MFTPIHMNSLYLVHLHYIHSNSHASYSHQFTPQERLERNQGVDEGNEGDEGQGGGWARDDRKR
jgi:hypothetical protein